MYYCKTEGVADISLLLHRMVEKLFAELSQILEATAEWKVGNTYKHECQFCEEEFESRAARQRYCSHKCYTSNRFWRQKDVREIAILLQKGRCLEKVPRWIKDMLVRDAEQTP